MWGQPLLPSNRTRGKNLRLCQGRFRLDVREKVFTGRWLGIGTYHPGDVVKSPSLEVLKKSMDLALWDMA